MFTADNQPTPEQRIRKTCRKGHLLEGDNVRFESSGKRRCRKCELSRRRDHYKEDTLDSDIKKNPRKYDLEDLDKAAREFVIKHVNEGTPFPAIAEAVFDDLRNDEVADLATLTDEDFQAAALKAAPSPLHCHLWNIHFSWSGTQVNEAIFELENAYPDLGIKDRPKNGVPAVKQVVWWWLRVTRARLKNFGGTIPHSFAAAIPDYLDQRPIKADVGPRFTLSRGDFADPKGWIAP